MTGLPAATGIETGRAAERLLKLQGLASHDPRLAERLQADPSAESLASELHARNLDVRIARIGTSDLLSLQPSTLVQLADASWLLVKSGKTRRVTVEDGDGRDCSFHPRELANQISGLAVEPMPEILPGRSLWQAAGNLIRKRERILFHLALATLFMQVLALLPPQLSRLAFDRALPEGSTSLLGLVALGLVMTAAFHAWVGWLRGKTILYLEARLETELGRGFLQRLLRLPFPFLQKKTLGDLLQGFYGLALARTFLTERALGTLLDAVTAVVYLVFMASILPAPTGAVAVVALTIAGVSLLIGRAQSRLQYSGIDAQSKQRAFLVELISGIATLKATGAETRGWARWRELFSEEISLTLRRQRWGLWSEVGFETLRQGTSVLLLVWGGSRVLSGEITTGSLMAFLQMSAGFLGAVIGLGNTYLVLAVAKPQLLKTREVLQTPSTPRRIAAVSNVDSGSLMLEDVWFRYETECPWIWKSLDLTIEPGQKHRILGRSGSGKTTLLRLISGLYSPQRGTIRIAGRDPLSAAKSLMYLPQSVQLYSGSILENLRIFSGHLDRDRILKVANETGLGDWVRCLPMGYNTLIPFGGGSLSGGQKQLIALTGVIASARPVLLLDEPMANLDSGSQARLLRCKSLRGRTIVYATHTGTL